MSPISPCVHTLQERLEGGHALLSASRTRGSDGCSGMAWRFTASLLSGHATPACSMSGHDGEGPTPGRRARTDLVLNLLYRGLVGVSFAPTWLCIPPGHFHRRT